MSIFPAKEGDVVDLAERMIEGLTDHGSDFPSMDLAALQAELTNYKEGKQVQEDTKGQLKIATTAKDEDLDSLTTLMKNELKKAEVDCTAAPQNLYEIGWGPRQEPSPIQAPGVPTLLRSTAEGIGEIWLAWDKPASDSGGTIRNYLIERCDQKPDNTFGPWMLVDTVYNNEAHLLEQPSNQRLIYRVKASNVAGASGPSNTLFVLLP